MRLAFLLVLACVTMSFAGTNPVDMIKGLNNLNGVLTAVFGVGFLGALGWIAKLQLGTKKVKLAVAAWTEAIAELRKRATDPELRRDFDAAFERTADILDDLKMKDLADKLRKAL